MKYIIILQKKFILIIIKSLTLKKNAILKPNNKYHEDSKMKSYTNRIRLDKK